VTGYQNPGSAPFETCVPVVDEEVYIGLAGPSEVLESHLMRIAALLWCVYLFVSSVVWCQSAPPQAAAVDDAESKRERDLKMPEIIRAMQLSPGAKVADIGAGDGDYEVALSRAIGAQGRIYAEDISSGAIKRLRQHLSEAHLENVEVVEGVAHDPKLPFGELDAALMIISYHEVKDYGKMLQRMLSALKPGGRFVVVDMSPHKTVNRPRADQVKNHAIAPDLVQSEARQAGFEVVSRDDHFIDRPDEESTRWMIAFRKPS
jgi:ubiquinone/menaquinone biosynthesis C-methylase UbiE